MIGYMYSIPIIEKLGGRAAMARALKAPRSGKPVGKKALNMWVMRGSVPGYAVVQMVELAKARRIQVQPGDFERQGTSRKSKKEGQSQ